MARRENTIQLIEVEEKLENYAQILEVTLNKIAADPTFQQENTATEVNKLIEQSLIFIRDNEILVTPAALRRASRLRAEAYNEIIDSTKIDLEAAFLRVRSVVRVINNTSNLLSSRTFGTLSKIDKLLDRIANLRNLKTTNDEFDNIINNTFIENDNEFNDNDFKTRHDESGGIITLRETFSDEIIREEANFDLFIIPINRNALLREFFRKMTDNKLVNAMDVSLFSYNNLFIRNYAIGVDSAGEDVKLNFNGGLIACILRLPAIKFINNIAMKFISAGLLDVVDVYSTLDSATNILDFAWTKVDFTLDTNNIRGTTLNFPTAQSGSIMIVFGQKSLTRITTENKQGLTALEGASKFDLNKFINEIQANVNIVSPNKIHEYVSPDVAKTLGRDTRATISTIISQLELLLPPDTASVEPDSTANQTDFT